MTDKCPKCGGRGKDFVCCSDPTCPPNDCDDCGATGKARVGGGEAGSDGKNEETQTNKKAQETATEQADTRGRVMDDSRRLTPANPGPGEKPLTEEELRGVERGWPLAERAAREIRSLRTRLEQAEARVKELLTVLSRSTKSEQMEMVLRERDQARAEVERFKSISDSWMLTATERLRRAEELQAQVKVLREALRPLLPECERCPEKNRKPAWWLSEVAYEDEPLWTCEEHRLRGSGAAGRMPSTEETAQKTGWAALAKSGKEAKR